MSNRRSRQSVLLGELSLGDVDSDQRRKRTRVCNVHEIAVTLDHAVETFANDLINSSEKMTENSDACFESRKPIPRAYICPLTMDVMFDPVLDSEGNTYEREAIEAWLVGHRTSPVSRQPLNSNMLIPNNALSDAIHDHMGCEWVEERRGEQERHKQSACKLQQSHSVYTSTSTSQQGNQNIETSVLWAASDIKRFSSAFQNKIDCYLSSASERFRFPQGQCLSLNAKGSCEWTYCRLDNGEPLHLVVDVPPDTGMFSISARELFPTVTPAVKDRMLLLNSLQCETKGGSLSLRKDELYGTSEVVFSYHDRVSEVSSTDFVSVLMNFVDTCFEIRRKLQATYEREVHAFISANELKRFQSYAHPRSGDCSLRALLASCIQL
jgi:hypothetical protein